MSKYKVGDVVLISDYDHIYFCYEELAKKMKLTNFTYGHEPSIYPAKGVVVNFSKHLDQQNEDNIYGVYSDGVDYLVSEAGLSLFKDTTANSITVGSAASSDHYINDAMQPIEIMQMTFSHSELLGFLKGNIIKYSFRAGKKQGESSEKDLNKVRQYKAWLDIVENDGTIDPRKDVI